jgi:hypothetical protein
VFRYEYDFMPKGIMTRLIVTLHHLIRDHALVWRNGVVLERQSTRAEITEDYLKRRISVRLRGSDSYGLLAIIDDQMERIHASFPRLKSEKFLPCNCPVCRESAEPFSFTLTELKDFADTGDPIQCRASRKLVDAAALLREVLPGALRRGPEPEIRPAVEEAEPAKEVFVSYSWREASRNVVDELERALTAQGIRLLRDRNEMRYKDSIRQFMERLGRGKCIVVVLSKSYLESKSCMFELTEIAGRKDLRDRVFPVVLEDAGIYEPLECLGYVRYWEKKRDELDAAMQQGSGANLEGIREDLDLYARIRTTAAGLVELLADMNALTADQHRESGFAEVAAAIQRRLAAG